MACSPSGRDTLLMRRFDELTDGEKTERLLRVVKKALLGYGLSGDLSLVASATNHVFRLRTGGAAYAVRVCSAGREHSPLQRELTWLAALGRDTSLSVPEPVLTLTGDLFRGVSMEGVPGTRACMVLRWIDGERREAELTPSEAHAIGRFAASLHAHAEVFRWPEELGLRVADPASRALAAADALSAPLGSEGDRTLLFDAVARVSEATSELGDGPEAVGIIHGDLRLRKLRHDAESVGAFGFDDCREGAYLDDLSVLWSELSGRETGPALQKALLDGYRSVRDLTDKPENALRAFAVLRVLEAGARGLEGIRTNRAAPHDATEREVSVVRQELARHALLSRED
jgi:Ser/Thr protein kinase RdoA (MazF antagonist)